MPGVHPCFLAALVLFSLVTPQLLPVTPDDSQSRAPAITQQALPVYPVAEKQGKKSDEHPGGAPSVLSAPCAVNAAGVLHTGRVFSRDAFAGSRRIVYTLVTASDL